MSHLAKLTESGPQSEIYLASLAELRWVNRANYEMLRFARTSRTPTGDRMFDSLAATFYEKVVGAYDAYIAERDANSSGRYRHLRTALAAASELYHFREHLPPEYAMTCKQVHALCPDYRLMNSLANVSKHRTRRDNDWVGTPLIQKADDVEEVQVVTRYTDEDGHYSHSQNVVFANCSDGVSRNVDQALTAVLNFWGSTLAGLGVTPFVTRVPPEVPASRFVARSEARGMALEALRLIDFNQRWRLFEFNNTTRTASPVDLTGMKASFRIRKPAFVLGISIDDPTGGEPIEIELRLTDEESQAYAKTSSDAERSDFGRQLLSVRRDEVEKLIAEALETRRCGLP